MDDASLRNTLIVASIATIATTAYNYKSIIGFVVRKVLLVCQFPRIEPEHPTLGTHKVGAIKIRLSKEFPAVQLFYPVPNRPKRHSQKWVSYYRPQAVKGVLKFLGNPAALERIMQFLQEAPHPLLKHYGAEPLQGNYPLVLYSHGLSGTMECYSQLCSQMASLGCVVMAVEHADTSASYATKIDADGSVQDVWYTPPDSSVPYSRQRTVGHRGPHAEQRVDELSALYQFLQTKRPSNYRNPNAASNRITESGEYLSVANNVLKMIDVQQLHLVGHSFGAATMLLAAQRWFSTNNVSSTGTSIVPLSLTALDAWNFPLSDAINAKGIPSSASIPILSILSEEWLTHPEIEPLKEFLRNTPNCRLHSYYAKNSMHQSFSDTQSWVPTPMAIKNENRGPNEPRHVTIRAAVEGFSKLTGIGQGDHWSCKSLEQHEIEALGDFEF